jgi:hypothetical protein
MPVSNPPVDSEAQGQILLMEIQQMIADWPLTYLFKCRKCAPLTKQLKLQSIA